MSPPSLHLTQGSIDNLIFFASSHAFPPQGFALLFSTQTTLTSDVCRPSSLTSRELCQSESFLANPPTPLHSLSPSPLYIFTTAVMIIRNTIYVSIYLINSCYLCPVDCLVSPRPGCLSVLIPDGSYN